MNFELTKEHELLRKMVRDFAEKYLEAGRLFALRFNKIIPKRHFCVVTDSRNPLSAAARNLLGLIYKTGETEND